MTILGPIWPSSEFLDSLSSKISRSLSVCVIEHIIIQFYYAPDLHWSWQCELVELWVIWVGSQWKYSTQCGYCRGTCTLWMGNGICTLLHENHGRHLLQIVTECHPQIIAARRDQKLSSQWATPVFLELAQWCFQQTCTLEAKGWFFSCSSESNNVKLILLLPKWLTCTTKCCLRSCALWCWNQFLNQSGGPHRKNQSQWSLWSLHPV